MSAARVLLVDDSAVVRRLLSEVLAEDPAIEVVGTAANGRIALAKIPQLRPDVVILDVDMPVLGGLETLAEIERSYSRLPVIMFSALTQRGADATIEALFRGAADYVTKPAKMGSTDEAKMVVRDALVPKIKALCGPSDLSEPIRRPREHPAPRPPATRVGPARAARPVKVVAFGASTGGPKALHAILGSLPTDFPVPILVVQHMPPLFTSYLAQQLSAKTKLLVREATAGAPVSSSQVWIAPGDFHLTVSKAGDEIRVQTSQDPPENSCRPSVDVLFRSVAATYTRNALAVVLTGMGSDGFLGAQQIRSRGGQIIAQNQNSSVVWGMPKFVVQGGLADRVLPAEEIAEEIIRRIKQQNNTRSQDHN